MANDVTLTPLAVPLVRQFSKQIAGHAVEKGSSKPGMMKHADGCLLKPILSPPRGPRELKFYQHIFDTDNTNSVDVALKSLLPTFRGIFKSNSEKEFLKLEDLTDRFNHPCILDVKMGAKTYDFEASEHKIRREQQKYKHTKVMGFCIPGMQVYNLKTQVYICKGKDYGKKLTSESVKDAFRLYLNSETGMSSAVIQSFLLHLCNVRNWFLTQTKYAFFASSLLLIYDADSLLKSPFTNEGLDSCLMHNSVLSSPHLHSDHGISDATISKLEDFELDTSTLSKINSGLENISKVSVVTEGVGRGHSIMLKATSCEEDEQRKASSEIFNLTDVRMIDFAHVFDSSSQDENYLHGLNNLISILEFLLKEAN